MKKIVLISLILILLLLLGLYFLLVKPKPTELKVSKIKSMIKITSPVFNEGQTILAKYTCKGEDINPPLMIENVSPDAKSLVLIVDDPDAPMGTFTHWLVWNIPPSIKKIEENSVPEGAILGTNDFGKTAYGGPCPPYGVHRYFFKIYALNTILSLKAGADCSQLEKAMEGHIVDQGSLMGKFSK